MAHHTFSIHVDAPPDRVFDLWTNLPRMGEWVGGVTGVTDISGPVDRVGTTYVVHFGPVKSPTEILDVERPLHFATRFGSWILRGTSSTTFVPDDRTDLSDLVLVVLAWLVRGQLPGRAREIRQDRRTRSACPELIAQQRQHARSED